MQNGKSLSAFVKSKICIPTDEIFEMIGKSKESENRVCRYLKLEFYI